MTMFRRRRSVLAGIGAVALLAAGSLGALALADKGEEAPGQKLASVEPGPNRFARAEGLDAADATHVFSLANGEQVGVVSNANATCLVKTLSGRTVGEACAGAAGVSQGQAITVGDECGAAEANRMEIVGLAPAGAASVRLTSSDGSSSTTQVIRGAFRFEGTNPAPGEPYPTGVQWLADDGAESGSAPLPVNGDNFCLPAE